MLKFSIKFVVYFILIAFFFLNYDVSSATERNFQTGTFSNIKYDPNSGDLTGFEIRIVYTKQGYQGTFQLCLGEPGELILVTPEFKGNKFSFHFISPHGGTVNKKLRGTVEGTISSKGIAGLIDDNFGLISGKINLPRNKSYWD